MSDSLSSISSLLSGLTGSSSSSSSGMSNIFAQTQMQQTDYQNAMTIAIQMQANAQKQQMERWKILQDTQTKIFEIQQDVTVNQAKTQDKLFNKWDEYIRG